MYNRRKPKSAHFIVFGFLILIAERITDAMVQDSETSKLGMISAALSFAATAFLMVGFSRFAKRKGYTGWLGVLGLINMFGFFILLVIPDKFQKSSFKSLTTPNHSTPEDSSYSA